MQLSNRGCGGYRAHEEKCGSEAGVSAKGVSHIILNFISTG